MIGAFFEGIFFCLGMIVMTTGFFITLLIFKFFHDKF